MGNSQPKHAPKHKRRPSKEEHETTEQLQNPSPSSSDIDNVRRTSKTRRNSKKASNNDDTNNNNNEKIYRRDLLDSTPTKGSRPMSLNTIPEDKLLAGEQRQQQQQQRSKSVSAGTSSFREYQRQRKASREERQSDTASGRSSAKDPTDFGSPKREHIDLRSSMRDRNGSTSSSSLDHYSPNISQRGEQSRHRSNTRNDGIEENYNNNNHDQTKSPPTTPTTRRQHRPRAVSLSSRPTRKSSRNEEDIDISLHHGRARSKSLSIIKNKDRKISIGADKHDSSKYVNRRPRSNSEVNEFRRKSLPVQIQKQLRKETLLSASQRRLSLGNAIIPTSPKTGSHDHRRLKVPFLFPLNKKLMVKLIPPKDSLGSSTPSSNGLLKHILFIRIVNQDKKGISKTSQLYKASILFTEGRLKDVTNRQTGKSTKRLVQAQIWSGVSQTVDFEDDAIQVTGNFMSRAKGMIPFLEFELVLKPNFKNTRSEDTGGILFSVGSFTFKDTRSAVNKAVHWQAVVENWRKHGDEDEGDDLGWDLPCEDKDDFENEDDEGFGKKEEGYNEEEWTLLFMQ